MEGCALIFRLAFFFKKNSIFLIEKHIFPLRWRSNYTIYIKNKRSPVNFTGSDRTRVPILPELLVLCSFNSTNCLLFRTKVASKIFKSLLSYFFCFDLIIRDQNWKLHISYMERAPPPPVHILPFVWLIAVNKMRVCLCTYHVIYIRCTHAHVHIYGVEF